MAKQMKIIALHALGQIRDILAQPDAAKWPKGSSDSTKSEGSAEVRYAENSVNNSEVFKTNAAVTNFCPKSRISAFSNSEEQRNNSERLPCRASTVCRAFAGCKRSPHARSRISTSDS